MTYLAKVIIANDIIPHPNADNLSLLRYNGTQFIVSKNLTPGTIVVLFPEDGQLSEEFCRENNLFRNASLNRDKLKAGFFEESRRVRAQLFRKEKSYGFVAELSMFAYLGKVTLSPGDEFDTLNGKLVCQKYYTPATLRKMKGNTIKKEREVVYDLKEHFETKKFSYYPPAISEPTNVVITEKVHGTSARTGYVKVTRKLKGIRWLIGLFNGKKENVSWEHVSGTRRTIVNWRADVTTEGQRDYYRWEAHNAIAPLLRKGETVYYEIVGYDSLGGTIMERQDIGKIRDKSKVNPEWRNPMVYSYGVPERERDIYIYRITMQTADMEIEFSWKQVVQRCRELGLKPVPILQEFTTDSLEQLQRIVAGYMTDGSSTLDRRHLMEGIVIRLEDSKGVRVLKEKNYMFGILEGYLKEKDSYVDEEEAN
jgi:hypothetical protein